MVVMSVRIVCRVKMMASDGLWIVRMYVHVCTTKEDLSYVLSVYGYIILVRTVQRTREINYCSYVKYYVAQTIIIYSLNNIPVHEVMATANSIWCALLSSFARPIVVA